MGLSAAIIDALVAAGATVEQLAAAMKADLAEGEARAQAKRAADAARQAKSRRNRGLSRNVTVTPSDECDAPNDIYSNPQSPSEAKASLPPLELKLVAEWNAGPAANGARKATKLDASRKTLLKARLRDNSEAEIFEAMSNLAASRFHCGENDRNWRASLGWFLKAENFLKALELEDPGPKSNGGFGSPAVGLQALIAQSSQHRRQAA